MLVSLEKAVQHYALLDCRAAARQEAIARNMQPLQSRGFPAGEALESIVKNAYLVHENLLSRMPKVQATVRPAFETALDRLLDKLTSLDLTQADLVSFQKIFGGAVRNFPLAPCFPPAESQVDLDSFEDRILITSLAFLNYCRLACLHCGNAGQWDGRYHTLDQLKSVRDKIRFPLNSYLNLSHQEPFALPFLLDAVKYLLEEGASIGLVTSGLGVSPVRRGELFGALQYFYDNYDQRVLVSLSFDLFRRREINSYLALIAATLNNYPVVRSLKFSPHETNREKSLYRLRQLLQRITRPAAREMVITLLEENHKEEDNPPPGLAPVGQAAAFDPSASLSYLDKSIDLFFPEQRLAPTATNFMFFPGGSIVPDFCWEGAQIQSLGNIFKNSPREIYGRYSEFEAKYRARLAKGIIPYLALVATEMEMRSQYGLPLRFVNHYDVLERLIA